MVRTTPRRPAPPEGRAILCPRHGKLLARVTPQGLELWCRCDKGHPVVLPLDALTADQPGERAPAAAASR